MSEHFLLKNVITLPERAILQRNQRSLYNNPTYLTKTCAAPGDDDDYDSSMQFISGWNNSFLTKTKAAPGDDDDYCGMSKVWSAWESLFY